MLMGAALVPVENVCLGETARNILLFGALLTAGILLDKILC
jgi:hypothetical protein